MHAKFKLGRRVLPIHRLSLEEDIFEAECMLEELWNDTGPSSLCEDMALLVCIARELQALKQHGFAARDVPSGPKALLTPHPPLAASTPGTGWRRTVYIVPRR